MSHGRLERDLLRQPVQPPQGALDVEQDERAESRDGAAVAAKPAAVLDHVLARPVGGEGLHPQLGGKGREAVLAGADPLPAELHHLAIADRLVEHPAPDPVAGLHHEYLAARRGQLARGHEPGQPGAHHNELRFVSGHRPRRYPGPRADALVCSRYGGGVASQTRQAREADRKLSVQTLAIASISSALAAVIVSQFWKSGTAAAAAITPVVVSVLSEMLHKPTRAITSRVTADRTAVLPEGAGAGAPAQKARTAVTVPATDTEATKPFSEERPPPLHEEDGETKPSDERPTREAPISYHRAGSNGGAPEPGRRRFPVKIVAITAALAFLIGAAILTVPELIAGDSVGKTSGGTTLFGGDRSASQDSSDSQGSEDSQQQQDQPSGKGGDDQPSGQSQDQQSPSDTQRQKTTETEQQKTPQQQPPAPKQAPAEP